MVPICRISAIYGGLGCYEAIARIVCRTEQEIQNKLAEACGNNSDYFDLARKLSIQTNAKFVGAYLGDVRRAMMLPDIEEAVSSASQDDVVGPFSESVLLTLYKTCAVHDQTRVPGTETGSGIKCSMAGSTGGTRYCHEGAKGIA